MSDLAITARRLGLIKLTTYCPRCLWYLLRLRFRPPFDHSGGAIFKWMEKSEKAIVGHYLDENECLPDEFTPFCAIARRVDCETHYTKFRYRHKLGVTLYGEPDEVFELADGSVCIIDHKTARNKGEEDKFLPMYMTQVVGYADIAENGLNLGTVSAGGLFYWEMDPQLVQDDPAKFYRNSTLRPPFVVKPHAFEIDYSILDPLIEEAIRVWESDTPPQGEAGCKDCDKLDALFALEHKVEITDTNSLLQVMSPGPEFEKTRRRRANDRHAARILALDDLQHPSRQIELLDDGMFEAWFSSED